VAANTTGPFAGIPGFNLLDEKRHLPNEPANAGMAGADGAREAAMSQTVAVAGLPAAPAGWRETAHPGKD